MNVLRAELEYSRASISRIIKDVRLFFDAPLDYDRKANGYHYATEGNHPFELPGLWFSAAELHALLAVDKLLTDLQPGLLDEVLAPLRARIRDILSAGNTSKLQKADIKRIRILSMASRQGQHTYFQIVATALLQRKRLDIHYYSRAKDKRAKREISPQRLTYYRDNWYLDAWCHEANGLRCFALDAIEAADVLQGAATDISESDLDNHFATSYGIFAGSPKATAVLRFSSERARWVSRERWHPVQEGKFLDDGRYELRFPIGDVRELVMDVMRYGADVEVVGPEELRREVAKRLIAAVRVYEGREGNEK